MSFAYVTSSAGAAGAATTTSMAATRLFIRSPHMGKYLGSLPGRVLRGSYERYPGRPMWVSRRATTPRYFRTGSLLQQFLGLLGGSRIRVFLDEVLQPFAGLGAVSGVRQ